MMKRMNLLVATLLLSLMTSCVSIFQGTRSEITLKGDLDTPINVAAGKDNFENLTLPCTIKVKKKTKNLLVYAPDYEMQNIVLKRRFNFLYIFNNFNIGIGYIVDACNGVIKRITDKEYYVNLTPASNSDDGYMDLADYYYNKKDEYRARIFNEKALEINPESERANQMYTEMEVVRRRRAAAAASEADEDFWTLLGKAVGSASELVNAISNPQTSTSSAISSELGAVASLTDTVDSSDNETSGKKSESYYLGQYQLWEQRAKQAFNFLVNGGAVYKEKKNGNEKLKRGETSGYTSMSSNSNLQRVLIKAQNQMEHIRREARVNGYTIPQSDYETIKVDWKGAKQYVPNN